jgi:hypothetical protein
VSNQAQEAMLKRSQHMGSHDTAKEVRMSMKTWYYDFRPPDAAFCRCFGEIPTAGEAHVEAISALVRKMHRPSENIAPKLMTVWLPPTSRWPRFCGNLAK